MVDDGRHTPVDCVYIAACARDARFTRICVASIRHFYPTVPIRLLPGEPLQRGLGKELKTYWNVDLVPLPRGDYGWGLVKLEPLFGKPGERFLVVDADTVFTGRVLDLRAETDAPFCVDDEQLSDADFKRLYYDWDALRAVDLDVQPARTAFNAGEWFGTAGLVQRAEFDPWVEWRLPRRLRHPQHFMGGDQGVLNYVILKKEKFDGLRIHRRRIMRWPGHGMADLTPGAIARGTAPALVVHWAGMKATLLRRMVGSDVLLFYEDEYYAALPLGRMRRRIDNAYHVWLQWKHFALVRLRLAYRYRIAAPVARCMAPLFARRRPA